MKKPQRNLMLRMATLLLLATGVIIVLVSAVAEQQQPRTAALDVAVEGPEGVAFLDAADLLHWLERQGIAAEGGTLVASLQLQELERQLLQWAWVQSGRIYLDARNRLQVRVRQRLPVIRIINSSGVGYYLDSTGRRLAPSNKFTARVPVAVRTPLPHEQPVMKNDSLFEYEVLQIIRHVRQDTFLHALVEQIHCNADGLYELIPLHGMHRIVIGDIEALQEKLSKVQPLYHMLQQQGRWSDYETVDLRFRNQVVCTRRSETAGAASGLSAGTLPASAGAGFTIQN